MRYRADGRWRDISWKNFGESIQSVAKGLLGLGVQEGEKIGIYSPNRPEWSIVDLAAMRVRAVSVPIFATSTAKQVEYIINDAEIRVLFVGGQEQYIKARSLFSDPGRKLKIVIFDRGVLRDASDQSVYFQEFRETGRKAARDDDVAKRLLQARPDDLATLIYTSGTTGEPKGVMLDHMNVTEILPPHDGRLLDLDENDESLCFLPLSHVYERCWTFYALSRGIIQHYLEDPTQVLEAMKQVRPTVMCAVPRLYEKIYASVKQRNEGASPVRQRLFHWAITVGAEYARRRRKELRIPLRLRLKHLLADALVLRRIRAIMGGRAKFFPCAGAPLSHEVEEFFLAAGFFILQGYGLTETCATVSCYEPRHFKPGTVGKPLSGTQVKIAENGEILVKGPGVMRGYYKKPSATAAAFADGWLRTGDAGTLDEEGNLTITDRIKDLIKTSGGKYVAPQQIESDLGSDLLIEQAAVIGDQRKFVSALIVPSFIALEVWAHARDLPFSSRRELIERPEVLRLYQERIDDHNTRLARHEQIKKFALLSKEFTVEGGEITPTMKTRRNQIIATYHDVIEKMYTEAA
ncbi:MAG: long-chain fatty acid--CoA ligase [Oligoflexia bacterium]|nr:long-chain fatty acid--CoA ligase [Oligoflexia bacterium]